MKRTTVALLGAFMVALAVLALSSVAPSSASPGLLGDVNDDNKVTVADAMFILKYSAELEVPYPIEELGDVNGDNKVTVADAMFILKYSAELPVPYPIGEEIGPANEAPEADFSWTPETPTTQDMIQFTDNSHDPDGTVIAWSWDFGDGDTSEDQNPTHQYADNGIYTVTLTVTDNGEPAMTGSVSKNITVLNVGPTANAGGLYTVNEGETAKLNGTGSSDLDGTIASYLWTIVEDPTEEAYLTGETTATPTFHAPFVNAETVVTISLTVTDDDGATDSDSTTVTVKNVAGLGGNMTAEVIPKP